MSYSNRPTSLTRARVLGQAVARSGVTLMARVLGHEGRPITRASLTSIEFTIGELTTATAVASGTCVVSNTVFDDLQQSDPRWTQDSAANPGADGRWGYNFAATLEATNFALTTLAAEDDLAAPRSYQIDLVFTPVSGQPWRVVFIITTTRAFA